MKNKIYILSIIGLLAMGVSFFSFAETSNALKGSDLKNVALTDKTVKSGNIYFVRHPEKVKGVKNPPLTTHGKQRAEELSHFLTALNIENIYATHFLRAQTTAMRFSILM